MLKGHQSWFQNRPVILASSAVGGPFEAKGGLAEDFDILHDDMWLGQDSFEKAEKKCWRRPVKQQSKSRDKEGRYRFFLAVTC